MPARPPLDRLPEASPYASHLPALDGLRGLAVLGVISSHIFPGNTSTFMTRALRFAFSFGAAGVDLFFVLSGFLITGILFDSLADSHFFRKFYARRILRIFPLYYGVLTFYALSVMFFAMHYDRQLFSMALFLQNTGLIARPIYDYAGPSKLPLAHFWSLAVEEQFYFIWPVVLFVVRLRRRLLLVCCGFFLLCPVLRATLLLHGWDYFPVHNNTFLRADSLLAGAALALLLRSRLHDRTLRAARWLALSGAFLTAALMANENWLLFKAGWWPSIGLSLRYTVLAVLFTGVLALSLQPGMLSSVCSLPVLRFFGRYSYGLYVIHLILFTYFQESLKQLFQVHLTANKAVGVGLTGLICFGLSVLAAVVSYHVYEKPFLRLKRFFSYRTKANGSPVTF